MKKFQLNLLAAGVLAFSLGACSSTNTDTTTGTTAETVPATSPAGQTQTSGTGANATTPATEANSFLVRAASSDLFETRSSELAKSRSIHPAAQVFAKMMRDDHGKNSEELRRLAAQKNVTLPTTMLPEHQRLMDPLNETNIGEKFDKRYLDAQINAHEQAIALYDQAVTTEQDPDIRAFAGRVLPKLRDHLVLAKKAKDALD